MVKYSFDYDSCNCVDCMPLSLELECDEILNKFPQMEYVINHDD